MDDLLNDSCMIQTRSLNSTGKIVTESWTDQAAETRCRAMYQTISKLNPDTAQHATLVRARFFLPLSAVVSIRDRIRHEGRAYPVIHVNIPRDADGTHHKVAVCEAVAGAA